MGYSRYLTNLFWVFCLSGNCDDSPSQVVITTLECVAFLGFIFGLFGLVGGLGVLGFFVDLFGFELSSF